MAVDAPAAARASRWTFGRSAPLLAAGLALAAFPLVVRDTYLQNVLTEVLIAAIFALSLDLLLGYTGLPSLGHAAFYGGGAYAAGLTAIHLSNHLLVSLPAGALFAALLAVPIGLLAVRSLGVYFLMLTLAFAQMVHAVAFKWTAVTGGSNGLAGIPRPTLGLGGLDLAGPVPFYYLTFVVFAATFLLLRRLVRSPLGRAWVGVRENETRMRAIGYDVQRYKLAAFVLAGLLAGLAGSLAAAFNGFVSPNDVYWTTSGLVMIMVIIGGAGTLVGPVVGAAVVLVLQSVISSATERWPLIMGAIFIVVVLAARRGLVGLAGDAPRVVSSALRKS